MSASRRRVAPAQLLAAAVCWGAAVTGTKYALRGFGAVSLLAVELIAAAVVLNTVSRLGRGRAVKPVSRGLTPSWRLAGLLGLLEPAFAYLAETVGLERTSAANAAVITGLESCFVVVLAALVLRERIGGALVLAVVAGLAGLAALEGTGWLSGPGIGDLLVAGGTFSAAVYVIVARRMDATIDPVLLTARQFTVAAGVVVPLAVARWMAGAEPVPTHVPARFWIAAVAVGVIGYALSFVLYNAAIRVVEAGPSAVVINLIPLFGLVSAVALLGERLDARQVTGAALLSASVAVFGWFEFRPAHRVGEVVDTVPAVGAVYSFPSVELAVPIPSVRAAVRSVDQRAVDQLPQLRP